MGSSIDKSKPKRRKAIRQQRFLNALSECGGRITDAAKAVGLSRQTHHNWYQENESYRQRFDAVLESIEGTKPNKRGRPTKYSPETVDTICSAISEGLPFTHAAAIAGLSFQTLSVWKKEKPCFSDAIEKAKAEGIQARLKLILSAAEGGDVNSAKWWLEHVVPEHFAKNRVDHQHKIEGNLKHSFAVPEEILNSIAEARKRNDDD